MSAKDIIIRFIDKFRKPRQKAITDISDSNRFEKFRNSYQFGEVSTKEELSLDDIIAEYIFQYQKQINEGVDNNVSYKAFTRMFYKEEEEARKKL